MSEIIKDLKSEDFANLFNVDIGDLNPNCKSLIDQLDFKYKLLDQNDRDRLILSILELLESPEPPPIGNQRSDWESRWSVILQNFIQSGYNISQLIPDFLRRKRPIRIGLNYGLPINYDFELNLHRVIHRWIFLRYLSDAEVIYEFGCGTAFNLVELAQLYPEKELHGLDWVNPTKMIIDLLAEKYGYNITGHVFDMASPDMNLTVKSGSTISTFGGLEQLGNNFEPFLKFVLSKSPSLCVNLEPLDELYDPANSLIDYMAHRFNHKRNYLTGYLARLRQLEKEGRVRIIKVHKMSYGLYLESYSLVVWKPI